MRHLTTKAFNTLVASLGMLRSVTSRAALDLQHNAHQVDFAEFCCSPTSGLASGMEDQ